MTNNTTPETEALVEEVQAERRDYDILDRITRRPKRKPEIATLYLDEESGQELGAAYDVKNEYGIVTGRFRKGVIGELDAERAKKPEAQDAELIAGLEARARELAAAIRKDSLEFTLQWIPPIAEEVLQKEVLEAVGLKSLPVPDSKASEYKKAWLSRAVVATLASFKDNMDGTTKRKLSIADVDNILNYLPDEQTARLDSALGALLYRASISREALDTADF